MLVFIARLAWSRSRLELLMMKLTTKAESEPRDETEDDSELQLIVTTSASIAANRLLAVRASLPQSKISRQKTFVLSTDDQIV